MACAAVSVDGLHAAIARDGELSLYTVEPFVEIARAPLAPAADRTIAFVGRQVLVFEPARLTVYSMAHRLAITAQLELAPPARLLATSQHYALLAKGELVIATCTSEGAALAPTRTPGTAEHAVGLDNARFLTWPKQGPAQIWDAATRLPVARVGLELPPDTTDVGTTGKHRSVWIATASGDLITSRLSDGKSTIAPLPRPPQRIASHPLSAWLVMDFDGIPHAVNSVLRSWQQLAIPPDRPRTLAPSIGSHAFVIVDEGEEIARHELDVEGGARKVVRIAVGGPLPEADDVPVPAAPPTPVARVHEARIETTPVAPVAPGAPARDAAPSLASRFAARDREPGRMRPIGAAPNAMSDAASVAASGTITGAASGAINGPAAGAMTGAAAGAITGAAPRAITGTASDTASGAMTGAAPRAMTGAASGTNSAPSAAAGAMTGTASGGAAGAMTGAAAGAMTGGAAGAMTGTAPRAMTGAASGTITSAASGAASGAMTGAPDPASGAGAMTGRAPGPSARPAWHDVLLAWARDALGDAPQAALPADPSPLAALCDRARLDLTARRIVHALYAHALAGHGHGGLAAARLVEIAGPSAWDEALGKGELGRLGVVRSSIGRCALARPVGAFLDGRPPERVVRVDGDGAQGDGERAHGGAAHGVADGYYHAAAAPAAIARVLGTVATCDRADVDARLEAWLRGWPLVVAVPPAGAPWPGELVIVTGARGELPELPDVPSR